MFTRACDWIVRAFRFEASNTIVVAGVEKEASLILTDEITNPTSIMIKQITFMTRIIASDEHTWYREVFCIQNGCNFKVKASNLKSKDLTHECTVMWNGL